MKKRMQFIVIILAVFLAVIMMCSRCGSSTTGKISKPITKVGFEMQKTDKTLTDGTTVKTTDETVVDGVDGTTVKTTDETVVDGVDGTTVKTTDETLVDGVDGTTVKTDDETTVDGVDETTVESSEDSMADSFDPVSEIMDTAWVAYDYNYNNGYPMYVLNFRADGTMQYMAGWVKSEIAFSGEGTWTSSGDQIAYNVTGDGYTFNGTLRFVLVADDHLTLSHVSGDALNYLIESGPMEFVVQGSPMDQPPI